MKTNRTWELVNFAEVPDCFKLLNRKYIEQEVQNGAEINGIEVIDYKPTEERNENL